MKKLLLLGGFIAVVGLTSCTKEYTCECTTVDSSGFFDPITTTTTFEASKSDAKAACDGLTATVGTLTTSCDLQ